MTGPSSNTARYDLYSNSSRTTLWGSWETGYDTAGMQLDVIEVEGSRIGKIAVTFVERPSAASGDDDLGDLE